MESTADTLVGLIALLVGVVLIVFSRQIGDFYPHSRNDWLNRVPVALIGAFWIAISIVSLLSR